MVQTLFGVFLVAMGMCSDVAYAIAANSVARQLRHHPNVRRRSERLTGAVCVCLCVSTALVGHPARQVDLSAETTRRTT